MRRRRASRSRWSRPVARSFSQCDDPSVLGSRECRSLARSIELIVSPSGVYRVSLTLTFRHSNFLKRVTFAERYRRTVPAVLGNAVSIQRGLHDVDGKFLSALRFTRARIHMIVLILGWQGGNGRRRTRLHPIRRVPSSGSPTAFRATVSI